MIVLRIALSFMIYRKSCWAFSNALLYAAMFIGIVFDMPNIDMDFEPIGKIAYVFCCLIGLYEVNGAQPFAAFFFPIILYIIALRISKSKSIATIPALMFGVSGLLQTLVYNRFHDTVIILLLHPGLCLVLRFSLHIASRYIFSSILLCFASIFILPFSLLGYNPYAVIDASEVVSLREMRNGLYQFQKDGKLGLRDRYGIVIYPNYDNYGLLGEERYARDYMVVLTDVWFLNDYAIENIYDLKKRRFILPDDAPDGLHQIEKTYDKIYAIFDRRGKQVYTLCLPSAYELGQDNDLRLIVWDSEDGKM